MPTTDKTHSIPGQLHVHLCMLSVISMTFNRYLQLVLSKTGVDVLFLVNLLLFTQHSLVHCRSKPKKGRKNHFGSILSHELQEFLGVESMPRTQVRCSTYDCLCS